MRTFMLLIFFTFSLKTFAEYSEIPATGVKSPTTIKIDKWGVAHIEADSEYDAYFTQGFNIARDRLWQIDLWHRRGLGRLSEAFGPAFIEKDRASRLFLYRGSIKKEWRSYGNSTRKAVTAFVNGINQYIDLIESGVVPLPIEFQLLGYSPNRWQVEDVVRIRVHGLSRNVSSEITRARVTRDLGLAADNLRIKLSPDHETSIPNGMDYSDFPDDVAKVYQLATNPVLFSALNASNHDNETAAVFKQRVIKALLEQPPSPITAQKNRALGSNNWAIAPEKTITQRPILASDPHRLNTHPSGRYIVHLKAPGLNVIGAGEPYIPGVSLGHNEHIAFGFTIFSADQEDLYQYETADETLATYRYKNRWRKLKVITESIPVRSAEPVTVTLKYTKHGPVIYEDVTNKKLYAVRAAWLKRGMAPYLGSLRYQKARSWNHYKRALRRFGNPSENHVYADIKGNIGWKVAGKIPYRKNWDGLLPVTGDGQYEWQGFIPQFFLPSEFNPSRGWVATANEMNLPENYPLALGYEWAAPYRFNRISEVLESSDQHSLSSSIALQTDYLSIPARELLAVIDPSDFFIPLVSNRIIQLKNWDKKLNPESEEAAFFEIWWSRFLRPLVTLEWVPEESLGYFADLNSFGDQEVVLSAIRASMFDLGPISKERMISLITQSILGTENKFATEGLNGKTWGELHTAHFTHPIAPLLPPFLAQQLEAGPPVARGGSMDTINSNWYATNLTGNFDVIAGTSWRMVIDVGEWDSSLVANTPGQSGDPSSPFYSNLLPIWAKDQSFPLVFSEQAVDENTVATIKLLPTGSH